jgi:hypothetical protein
MCEPHGPVRLDESHHQGQDRTGGVQQDEEKCRSDAGTSSDGNDDVRSSGSGTSKFSLELQLPPGTPDHTFKVLLVGDSGVGKTSIVMRAVGGPFNESLPATVGE